MSSLSREELLFGLAGLGAAAFRNKIVNQPLRKSPWNYVIMGAAGWGIGKVLFDMKEEKKSRMRERMEYLIKKHTIAEHRRYPQ